jgi:hypothetical protein
MASDRYTFDGIWGKFRETDDLWIPTQLGNRILGYLVDARLAAQKAIQDKQIEEIKAGLDHLRDRSTRSNQGEYNAVVAAWEHFTDAYIATQQCIVSFISHPDLNQMSAEDLDGYLETTPLSLQQKKQVAKASDKTRMYVKIVQLRYINAAGAAIYDARSILRKQGIFIPEELEAAFENALKSCSEAHVEQSMRFEFGRAGGDRDATGALVRDGVATSQTLKTAVRERIFRNPFAK